MMTASARRVGSQSFGVAAAVGIIAIAVFAFVSYLVDDLRLLVEQGPLSLRPEVAQELQLFFDVGFLRNAQIATHVLGLAVFWSIGALVLLRGGSTPMRTGSGVMLFLLGAALFAPLSTLDGGWHFLGDAIGTLTPDPTIWRSLAGLSLLLFAVVFPTGRPVGRVWIVGVGIVGAHAVLWTAFPDSWLDPRTWAGVATVGWTLAPAVGAVAALGVRFAGADDRTRGQIRLVVVAFVTTVSTVVAFWALDPRLESGLLDLVLATRRLEVLHDVNLLLLLSVGLLLIPIGIAVSVARHGLWDVDLLLNRALVYGTLTAIVAAAFVVGVVGIGSLLASSLGRGRAVAGVATGVVLVLAFQPARRRVQAAVDRRFYREKYDGERALAQYMSVVSDLVAVDAIEETLRSALGTTVQPESVRVVVDADPAIPTAAGFVERPDSQVGSTPIWPGGAEALLPLVAQGHALGCVYLGPRRSGGPYTSIDRRLLERFVAATAPAVRVAQLVEEQERQAAERMRLESEMAVARTIQHDLLPRSLPDIGGWRFAAAYESAREVGGDYYDAIVADDGRIAVLVADVSGKGVPAAMVMATCRTIVRSVVATVLDPAEVVRQVNSRISGDIHPGMFVTCFFGVIDPVAGILSFANAGHTLPLLRHADGSVVELRATGMPFGWMADADYEPVTVELPIGSLVVIPSDGVIEARNPAGEFFGVGGFSRVVAGSPDPTVVEQVLDALRSHCAPSTDLGDDVTMLAFARG